MMVEDALQFQAIRESLGLTQGAVADLLHVQQPTVSRWESGGYAIPSRATDRLALLAGSAEGITEEFMRQGAARGVIEVSRTGRRVLLPEASDETKATIERVAAARAWIALAARDDAPDCVIVAGE